MYRPLTDAEIRQLEHQGCRADEWAAVRVADAFRPETVAMVRFCGDVRLGEFGRPVELAPGVRVPSGVTRAVLSDCTVGDGCLVRDVGCYLHGYRLDDGAMVMNCGTLSADADAEFGMDGAMAEASDEVPRRVAACDGLQAPMAALMLTGSPAAVAMRRLAARRAVAWASEERNVIGRGAVVANTVRLVNTYVGDSCEVNGASALTECALLSTDEAPVWVGAGVIAEDTVVGAGSTLDGATRLYNCYVGDYIRMRGVQASRRCFFAETPPDHGTPEAPAQRLDADGWTPERPAFRRMTPMAYDAAVSGGEADDEACGGYLRSLLDAYTLTPAGELVVDEAMKVNPDAKEKPELMRYGMQIVMPKAYGSLTYYGKGPGENYIDRNHGDRLGVYDAKVADQYWGYIRPQESGNKTEVRYWQVKDEYGRGLEFYATAPMECSTLSYLASDLDDGWDKDAHQSHSGDLTPRDFSVVKVAARQRGLACEDSWGAIPLPQYRMPYQDYDFTYVIRPL